MNKFKEHVQGMDSTEWWLSGLVVALCAVPAYAAIWMFHVFFQIALVPLAYIALVAGVVALVFKACKVVIDIKRRINT